MSGLPVEVIVSASRKQKVVRVRAAIIYVARQYSEGHNCEQRYSYPRIAHMLNRDHTSILHSLEHFDVYCQRTPWLREFTEELQQRVENEYSDIEKYLAQARKEAEEEEMARQEEEAARAAKQLYYEMLEKQRRASNRKARIKKKQREREELLKRVRHDLIPTHKGLAKNDFKPLFEEEIDEGHRAMTDMAHGSRKLLEAILKERKNHESRNTTFRHCP